MKIKHYVITLAFLSVCMNGFATDFFKPDEAKTVGVNNRILAKVNGKAITVFDVKKKMDMLFYKSFPEYTSSSVARYQFYQAQWKHVLQDLIDKELIMADAEENKLQVTNGEIRQDMESIFGPNIIANLDKVGLSFDEAWKMVHADIVIKRMLYIRAQSKAMKQVTPQVVKDHYNAHAKDNIVPDTWTYNVVTVRDPDSKQGKESANQIHTLLAVDHVPLADLLERVKSLSTVPASSKVTISEELTHNEKEMSEAFKQILSNLSAGSYSEPIAQKSRADNTTVYRMFLLKEFHPGGVPPFSEVANEIRQKLMENIAGKETDAYIKRLRKHFDVQEVHLDQVSNDEFEPFHLG